MSSTNGFGAFSDSDAIKFYNGDEQIGCGNFLPKDENYTSKLTYLKEKSQEKSGRQSEVVTQIVEAPEEDRNWSAFLVELPDIIEQQQGKGQYYIFLGEFPKSEDSAFWMIFYCNEDDARKIFEMMNLQFLHE